VAEKRIIKYRIGNDIVSSRFVNVRISDGGHHRRININSGNIDGGIGNAA
jgi:hypothetical protein